jgi:ABC-type multidrug transport system ATPase subunit
MAKRLALARATLHDPDLLVLDEPFSGLDRASLNRVLAELRELGSTAVLVATHDIDRGFDLADRIVLLADGRRVGEIATAECDGPAQLRQQYDDLVVGE